MAERTKLLWFGRPPTPADRQEAENRGFQIEQVVPGTAPDFRFAQGATFWGTQPFFETTADELEANLHAAIDHGLYLHVVVNSEAQLADLTNALKAVLPHDFAEELCRVRTEPVAPHEGPQAVLMHKAGPPANPKLDIDAPDCGLSDDQRLLLQRAFHDCDSIVIKPIAGGLSGAQTFLVDATLTTSYAGLIPSSFFIKFDTPGKLREEMKRFREFAEHHIDWHLRPNFSVERSLYGMSEGILVGAFVRSSRSLWQIVLEGEGPAYIRSLFGETLAGLRREAGRSIPEQRGSVVEPLDEFCKRDRIPEGRVIAAREFGGTIHSPRTLWRKLLDLPAHPWRPSAIHGDMHGENVRGRKGDAIVIDFAHACPGPMSADVASLEVWLAFKAAPEDSRPRDQWRHRVDSLYAPDALARSLAGAALAIDGDAIATCVDELRRVARDSVRSTDEYNRVVAVYLLRQAAYPADPTCAEEDEFRRTYAYWLANQLVLALCAAHESQLEPA